MAVHLYDLPSEAHQYTKHGHANSARRPSESRRPLQLAQILALQRTAGNAAVAELIAMQRCGPEDDSSACLECGRPARGGEQALVQRQATAPPATATPLATATTDAGAAAGATPAAAADAGTKAACPLKDYSGSKFNGDTARIDSNFEASMDSINAAAVKNDVMVHVTSSFRTSTVVPGAVVTPAEKSNHMVGHAIDMNVEYGAKHASYCNSTCLGGTLPTAVKGFIDDVKGAGLRWGGDFSDKDPVHIDDGLNVNDSAGWDARYKLIHDSCS